MKRYDKYKESGIPWIGEIPEHWEEGAFGRYFTFGKGLSITKADLQEDGIAVISYGQIHSRQNTGTSIKEELVRKVSPEYLRTNSQSLLKLYDIIFADTSEDLEGAGNNAYNDYSEPLFAGYHTIIARPKELPFSKYFAYLLQSRDWRASIQSLVNGIKVYSITKSILKKSFLLLPPLAEQEAIVAYLEEKVAQMDNLVAKQEAQTAYLQELKQAIIARAVTQGLDSQAPLRPSGIPWIGAIPDHWKVRMLSQLSQEYFVSNKDIKHQNLLSLSYGRIIQRDINTAEGLLPASYDTYQVIRKGNIVLRLTDLQNDQKSLRVGLSTQEGIITSAYLTLASRSNVNPKYLYFSLHTADIKKVFYGMGSGLRQNLNWKELRKLLLPLPSLAEQEAIVTYINRKTEEIDHLITMTEQGIARVRELKQALIADVVTGRISVQPS